MRKLFVLALVSLMLGCAAGKYDYIRPSAQPRADNSKIINRPREVVWNGAVPALGKQFFVINNLDKSSGLINLSYSGDPENYVDCGRLSSYVKNVRGERTYDFPAAKADQMFEVMDRDGLFAIRRKMSLEGRINLIFEELGSDKTSISANTRYVITRSISTQSMAGGIPSTDTDSISFNSGSGASFPPMSDGRATECVPTGKLESNILALID